jgi:hypothetical protein
VVAAIAANAESAIDPTLDGRALQDALRRAIATRRGYCSWTVDLVGWVVTPHSPTNAISPGKRSKKPSRGAWSG